MLRAQMTNARPGPADMAMSPAVSSEEKLKISEWKDASSGKRCQSRGKLCEMGRYRDKGSMVSAMHRNNEDIQDSRVP
jgi:hypothetical protein